MKKLVLNAAVVAAMVGGAAHAAVTLDGAGKVTVTPADTYEIYLSGASALDNNIERLATSTTIVAAERLCDNTQPVFKLQDQNGGASQKAFYCTLNPLNPQLVGLAGGKTNVLIYKRNEGGSAMGVAPIIDDAKGLAAASIEFLNIDPSICDVPAPAPAPGALSTAKCTYNKTVAGQFQKHIPDFGVSDVDPAQFVGVNTPSGFSAVNQNDVNLLKVESAGGQVFGIGATLKLRNALQEVQFPVSSVCNPLNAAYAANAETEACMPSLQRDQIASLLTGRMNDWNDFKIGGTGLLSSVTIAANKPSGGLPTVQPRVHVCTRSNGSGTKAQAGIKFLNYPCSTIATAPSPDNTATPELGGATKIHGLSSAGAVDECLSELNDGVNSVGTNFNNTYSSRWAIGVLSLDRNNTNTKPWRYVKINGVAPTLENVSKGKYLDWAELTFQYANFHVFDAGEKAIVDELIKAASNPVVLNTLNAGSVYSWGASGLLASPKNYAPDANGVLNLASPINPYTHATDSLGVNNCRIPTSLTGNVQLQ